MARSRFEIRAQKKLEEDGWFVDYKIRPRIVPKGYNVDFFGLFDLIAVRFPDEPIRWISVKGKGSHTAHRREVKKFDMPEGNVKELWRYDRDPEDKRKLRRRVRKFD